MSHFNNDSPHTQGDSDDDCYYKPVSQIQLSLSREDYLTEDLQRIPYNAYARQAVALTPPLKHKT